MGRRTGRRATAPARAEHPHGRGEKDCYGKRDWPELGTSPRAWGEATPLRAGRAANRNIPTGVGRRACALRQNNRAPEHPHGRGEKRPKSGPNMRSIGTSPRAWGEESRAHVDDVGRRNIPTGVGRSATVSAITKRPAEHPHGRGEKATRRRRAQRPGGTSPRAWGEGGAAPNVPHAGRNIPTGVGRRRGSA